MTNPIARLRSLGIILTVLSVPVGCGTSNPTSSALIDVVITAITVGEELDPDGYQIIVDGAPGGTLPINGELELRDLSSSGHPFAVQGIAPNCRLTNVPTSGFLDPRFGTTLELVIFCLQDEPGRIIYSAADQELRTRNALGGDIQDLGRFGSSSSVTQDGQRMTYDFSGDIWVANIDGSNPVNVSNTTGDEEGRPNWSPDGTRIVYDARVLGQTAFDVFVMNDDGSGVTNLTPGTPAGNDSGPAWSPDGTRIVFSSDRAGAGDLYTMASNGSNVVRLTTGTSDSGARWSPDGQRIVFARFLDPAVGETDFELFTIDSDGTSLAQITDNGLFRTTDADWSPDGAWMIISSVPLIMDGVPDLYMMRSDGTDIIQLSFLKGARLPRWIP